MKKNRWLLWLVVLIMIAALVAGGYLIARQGNSQATQGSSGTTQADSTNAMHSTTGESTAPSSSVTEPSSSVTEPSSSVTSPSGTDSTKPEHAHEYTAAVTAPTCTEGGYTTYTCACGDSYAADEVAALGHTYNTVTVPPTTQGQGYDVHTCIRCGDAYEDNFVEKLPEPTPDPEHTHAYTAAVTEPTCTTAGHTVYTCECGDSYLTDEVAATGHDYAATVTEPTCTAGGYTTYVCKACNHSYTDDNTAALGHDYETETVPPTQEAEGYDLHTCTRCGHSYKDNYTDPQTDYTLSFNRTKKTLDVGETYTITYEYSGSGTLTWSSSDTDVATVCDGVVTAKRAGTTVITLSDGERTAQMSVKVINVITVAVEEIWLIVGETYQIEYTYTGDKNELLFEGTRYASVDENGLITALEVGTTRIDVYDDQTCESIRIHIAEAYATEIDFTAQDAPIYDGVVKYVGDRTHCLIMTRPLNAFEGMYVSSSDPDIVSVETKWDAYSEYYLHVYLHFHKAGSADITFTSEDGEVTIVYTITVKENYDFDPGDGQLSPEDWAEYCERVMCEDGFESYDPYTAVHGKLLGSWRMLTLSADKLTFDVAVSIARGLVHEWTPCGDTMCQITYEGMNERGEYVFYTRWG